MIKLGELADLRAVIDRPLIDRKEYNAKIGLVCESIRLKIRKIEAVKGEWYVEKNELEPMLTEEEKEFIGQFWKSRKLANGERIYFTKADSIRKILLHKFHEMNKDWQKEQIGKKDLPKVAYLR